MSELSIQPELPTTGRIGLWFFLAADAMFFLALIGASIVLRSANADLFAKKAIELRTISTAIAIALLVVSAAASHVAARFAKSSRAAGVAMCSLISLACLAGYIATQFIVFYGADRSPNIFLDVRFLFAGVHVLHVVLAMILNCTILAYALEGKTYPLQTEYVGLYGAFVTIVGIVLYTVLILPLAA